MTALVLATSASAGKTGGNVVALVTAEQQNQLIAVELPSGKILRRVALARGPENVAVWRTKVVVASPASGAVTLLDGHGPYLGPIKVFRGFEAPHIVATSSRRGLAYVTDDPRGELSVIGLGSRRLIARIRVGVGAHHMSISPDGHHMWIALGERATSIAVVDLSPATRPRLLRRFSPGFAAHDLTFSPDGRRVWVTSASEDSVHVLNARTGREAFAVRVGSGPQHVAFAHPNGSAFVTSGYSSRIVKVDPASGRILARARTPYGSFNLSSMGDLVTTTSLLNGTVTEFDVNLRRLLTVKAADSARGIAVTVW